MSPRRFGRRQRNAVATSTESATRRIHERLIWITILIGIAVIPLYYSPSGKDPFRFPKEILLRAEAIIIVAIAMASARRFPIRLSRHERVVMLYVLVIVGWTAVVTVTSTHRTLSLDSLTRVVALAIIFSATYFLARGKSVAVLLAIVAPSCVNAAAYIARSLGQGSLFRIATDVMDRPAAFLGNANDIGAFFVAPALACLVWTTTLGTGRIWAAIAGVLIFLALLATQTLTPLIAFAAGLLAFVVVRWRRRVLLVSAILLVGAVTTVFAYRPLFTRVRVAALGARSGNVDSILSGRLLPFFAAWRMFATHPVLGVGPGCYGFQYFPYKLKIASDHPDLINSTAYGLSFGEAHNDHLQTLAVAGAPAYVLFVASLIWIGRLSLRPHHHVAVSNRTAQFARFFALPLVVSFVVLAGATFPLEVAATTASHLFLGALVARWSE